MAKIKKNYQKITVTKITENYSLNLLLLLHSDLFYLVKN